MTYTQRMLRHCVVLCCAVQHLAQHKENGAKTEQSIIKLKTE